MQHLLLHAAGSISTQSLRLVQLVDIARLSADWDEADWAGVLADHGDGPPWWALPPLRLAARHQRLTLPPAMLEPLERACPRRLVRSARNATIEDVSYVQAQVIAFPGLEWSRTPASAWRLMRSRLLPSAETRRLRKPGGLDHPAAQVTRWSSMSQTRRVLHWLTARPLRAVTLHALQLALDYEAR